MTQFWREGHWRYSSLGTSYWVDGHWVDRSDWSRASGYGYSAGTGPTPDAGQDLHREASRFSASDGSRPTFVDPNASCPVCGQAVFYYQNDHGSRVYFDELGPPWPKHPCTDSRRSQEGSDAAGWQLSSFESAQPATLSPGLTEQPGGRSDTLRPNRDWPCFIVLRSSEHDGRRYIVAEPTDQEYKRHLRFSVAGDSDFPDRGEIFFLNNDRASYFSFRTFSPAEATVTLKPSKSRSAGKRAKRRKRRNRRH